MLGTLLLYFIAFFLVSNRYLTYRYPYAFLFSKVPIMPFVSKPFLLKHFVGIAIGAGAKPCYPSVEG